MYVLSKLQIIKNISNDSKARKLSAAEQIKKLCRPGTRNSLQYLVEFLLIFKSKCGENYNKTTDFE